MSIPTRIALDSSVIIEWLKKGSEQSALVDACVRAVPRGESSLVGLPAPALAELYRRDDGARTPVISHVRPIAFDQHAALVIGEAMYRKAQEQKSLEYTAAAIKFDLMIAAAAARHRCSVLLRIDGRMSQDIASAIGITLMTPWDFATRFMSVSQVPENLRDRLREAKSGQLNLNHLLSSAASPASNG